MIIGGIFVKRTVPDKGDELDSLRRELQAVYNTAVRKLQKIVPLFLLSLTSPFHPDQYQADNFHNEGDDNYRIPEDAISNVWLGDIEKADYSQKKQSYTNFQRFRHGLL